MKKLMVLAITGIMVILTASQTMAMYLEVGGKDSYEAGFYGQTSSLAIGKKVSENVSVEMGYLGGTVSGSDEYTTVEGTIGAIGADVVGYKKMGNVSVHAGIGVYYGAYDVKAETEIPNYNYYATPYRSKVEVSGYDVYLPISAGVDFETGNVSIGVNYHQLRGASVKIGVRF